MPNLHQPDSSNARASEPDRPSCARLPRLAVNLRNTPMIGSSEAYSRG